MSGTNKTSASLDAVGRGVINTPLRLRKKCPKHLVRLDTRSPSAVAFAKSATATVHLGFYILMISGASTCGGIGMRSWV